MSNTEITTNVTKSFDDKSDYEEDVDSWTDLVIHKIMNMFKKQVSPFAFNMGSPYIKENEIDEAQKQKMAKMIKELIQNKTNDNEIVNKSYDNEINNNLSIDKIQKKDVITSLNAFIDSMVANKKELSQDEVRVIFNHLITKLKEAGINAK
jgi:hypothetical protein